MSYSPPLLAKRRWSPGGMTATDMRQGGPPVSSLITGARAHRAANANNVAPAIPPGTNVGDTMLLILTGTNFAMAGGWTNLGGVNPQAGLALQAGYRYYVPGDTAPVFSGGSTATSARIITLPGRWVPSVSFTNSTTTAIGIAGRPPGLSIDVVQVGVTSNNPVHGDTATWTTLDTENLDGIDAKVFAATLAAQTNTSVSWAANSTVVYGSFTFTGASVNTMWSSAWQEISPAAPYDTFQLDLDVDPPNIATTTTGGFGLLEFAVGAAGSEQVVHPGIEISNPLLSSYGPGLWVPHVSVPMYVKAGQRVAWRGWHNWAQWSAPSGPSCRVSFGGN